MLVHPFAPFGIVHREHRLRTLLFGQRGQEHFGGFAHWSSGNAGRTDCEQPRLNLAICSDAFEGLRVSASADILAKRSVRLPLGWEKAAPAMAIIAKDRASSARVRAGDLEVSSLMRMTKDFITL